MSRDNATVTDEDSDDAVMPAGDHWHIIESSDRWYQAHQRCVATSIDSRGASVHRWSGKTMLGLMAHLRQTAHRSGDTRQYLTQQQAAFAAASVAASSIYLVWEFPLAGTTPDRLFDVLTTIGELCPFAIQMAHTSSALPLPVVLALQEAGISIMLDDLWTLQRIIQRIDSRGSVA